ncbi:MAG: ATP-dependent metallopeptidase FtsH/Yme1/Tma family protein, partial [Vagococcus sp.]|nr:ATP-dependent metallopeptidase FtsH/Yme1/Tma family protein [Vagococcus sp.]
MNKKRNGGPKSTTYYIILLLAMVVLVSFFFNDSRNVGTEIPYSAFSEKLEQKEIKDMEITPGNGAYVIKGTYN